MAIQLKIIQSNTPKGKSPSKTQVVTEELAYLMPFNHSIACELLTNKLLSPLYIVIVIWDYLKQGQTGYHKSLSGSSLFI